MKRAKHRQLYSPDGVRLHRDLPVQAVVEGLMELGPELIRLSGPRLGVVERPYIVHKNVDISRFG